MGWDIYKSNVNILIYYTQNNIILYIQIIINKNIIDDILVY